MSFPLKRFVVTIISGSIFFLSYWLYCGYFWNEYRKNFSVLQPNKGISESSYLCLTANELDQEKIILTKGNYQNYTWHRKVVEPYHLDWVNNLDLTFPNDSTILVKVVAHYIDVNFYTYPITKTFITNLDTFKRQFVFNSNKMSFMSNKTDSVQVKLLKNKLYIKKVFL